MNRGGSALDVFCTGYEVLRELRPVGNTGKSQATELGEPLEVANVD